MKIWYFDSNRRVYTKPATGFGVAIYAEHWSEYEVVEETSRSWVLSNGLKVPKNEANRPKIFALERWEVERDIWNHDHRHRIVNQIQSTDVVTLMKVAEVIGYKDDTPR